MDERVERVVRGGVVMDMATPQTGPDFTHYHGKPVIRRLIWDRFGMPGQRANRTAAVCGNN